MNQALSDFVTRAYKAGFCGNGDPDLLRDWFRYWGKQDFFDDYVKRGKTQQYVFYDEQRGVCFYLVKSPLVTLYFVDSRVNLDRKLDEAKSYTIQIRLNMKGITDLIQPEETQENGKDHERT